MSAAAVASRKVQREAIAKVTVHLCTGPGVVKCGTEVKATRLADVANATRMTSVPGDVTCAKCNKAHDRGKLPDAEHQTR